MKRGWRVFRWVLCIVLAALLGSEAGMPVQAVGTKKEKHLNVLLIGRDEAQAQGSIRSDTMILCSFNPDIDQLVLTSFLRDLYVPIPGHGKNRINAAYAIGGAPLLARTLEENFDITIDGTIQVDFSQFAGIIDLLGGVELELRPDEAAHISQETGTVLSSGVQRLNGQQALSYARIRCLDTDGDFSRTARQRKLLETVWDTYKGSSLPTLIRVVGSLIPMLETDFGSGELLQTAIRVFPHLQQIEIISHRIPANGQYTDRVIDGMAVLVADMDAARKSLQDMLWPQEEGDM